MKLREIDIQDIERINVWRNNPEIIHLLGNNFLYIAETVDRNWYQQYLNTRTQNVRLAIIPDDTDNAVGIVNLTGIHAVNRSAEFSIMIGDTHYWGKGIGKVATLEMLKHGFQNLNLHRIYLYVLTRNSRAIHMYEKVGFQQEGLLREAVFKNGVFEDMVLMSVLQKDFNILS
jgi:RimJ/RimL family protein N-acetyltransferase